jgi:hypothetical protein
LGNKGEKEDIYQCGSTEDLVEPGPKIPVFDLVFIKKVALMSFWHGGKRFLIV